MPAVWPPLGEADRWAPEALRALQGGGVGQASWASRQTSEEEGGEMKAILRWVAKGLLLVGGFLFVTAIFLAPIYLVIRFVKWAWLN
jgi:hypothetical protein